MPPASLIIDILCYLGLGSTFCMVGIVWFAQLVHYPLLDRGRTDDFPDFAREYQRRTLWVVTPGLAGEVISSVGLITLAPGLPSGIGFALLLGIWLLTCRYQIPQHLSLKKGYSVEIHRALVQSNLTRSLLWSVRAGVMIWTTISLTQTH